MTEKIGLWLAAATLAMTLSTAIWAEDTTAHIDTSGVNMQPTYPASALPKQETGSVLLRVAVRADGGVNLIHLLDTSGYNDLDSAAIAAVMGWKFIPAMKDNRPVAGETNVQVGFQPPGTSALPANGIRPAQTFIPSMLEVSSDTATWSIPCANGGLKTTMLLEHAADFGSIGHNAVASIRVRKNDDAAVFSVTNLHGSLTLAHGQVVESEQIYPYSHVMAVGILITWRQSGLISTTAGRQTYQVQLPSSPAELAFVTANTSATFWNSDLVCFAGQPHVAVP